MALTLGPARPGFIAVVLLHLLPQASAQDAGEPFVAISVRSAPDNVIEQGEALHVAVIVGSDEGGVLLAPAGESWADAIEVSITSEQGLSAVALPVGIAASASLSLTPDTIAEGLWRVSPDATSTLTPGHYVVRARLSIDTVSPGSAGWTGTNDSTEVSLRVVAPSSEPGRKAQRALSLAQDAMLDNRPEKAADIVDALLDEQPENVEAWTTRALISELGGNPIGAILALDRARPPRATDNTRGLDSFPVEQITIRRRLLSALADGQPRDPDALPAWSWPPDLPDSLPQIVAGEAPEIGEAPKTTIAATSAGPAVASAPVSIAATTQTTSVQEVTVVAVADVDEAAILADSAGQWASTAVASSEYGKDRYNAMQATGAPNVESYSDNPNAWCHSGASVSHEWLEVGFANPRKATGISIRQTYTPGTLSRIEAFGDDGSSTVLWEGRDPNTYAPRQIGWFVLRFPETTFPVSRVRLTLNVAAISGWKQIDAVQLR